MSPLINADEAMGQRLLAPAQKIIIILALISIPLVGLSCVPLLPCSACYGLGQLQVPQGDSRIVGHSLDASCDSCGGTGKVSFITSATSGEQRYKCANCGGSGNQPVWSMSKGRPLPCSWCNGTGAMSGQRRAQFESMRQAELHQK